MNNEDYQEIIYELKKAQAILLNILEMVEEKPKEDNSKTVSDDEKDRYYKIQYGDYWIKKIDRKGQAEMTTDFNKAKVFSEKAINDFIKPEWDFLKYFCIYFVEEK